MKNNVKFDNDLNNSTCIKKSSDQLIMYILYHYIDFQEKCEVMVFFAFPTTLLLKDQLI